MTYSQRIVATHDIFRANGSLRIQKGAEGHVSAVDRGILFVVFDADQEAFVELDGGGRPHQEIEAIHVKAIN